jgi:endonuclease YncB( thermonuclease family)
VLTAAEHVDTQTLRVRVLRVFDGDGFLTRIWHPEYRREVEIGARFGFIDAPEMDQPGGVEAKQFLEKVIADKWLELAILLKYDTGQIFDRHKRLVCVPYLPEDQSEASGASPLGFLKALISPFGSGTMMRNVELEMVLNGWAWVVEKYGPDEKYLEALADARNNRRGIWAQTDNVAPWHFKQSQHRKIRKNPDASNQPNLFANSRHEISCPKSGCGGHLVQRSGKFGPFLGCSNFPRCKYSRAQ